MALSQEKFREIVFQALFSSDFTDGVSDDLVPTLMRQSLVSRRNILLAVAQANRITAELEELDKKIAGASTAYALERIARAEKNVLRLAIFELLYGDVPPKVAISEGIRLARKYASPQAAQFVNAILDQLYQERLSHAVAVECAAQ